MRHLASFLIAVLLATLPASAADITGQVVIKSKIRKRATGTVRKVPRLGGYDVTHTAAPPEDETQYVVVYVEKVDSSHVVVSDKHPVMLQENKEFHPHVLPVVAGQTVDFPNNDKIYHNVYSESAPNKFELPEYAGGKSESLPFKSPGVVELFCGIHTTMNAYIVVLQNQFYAMPDANHGYTIHNLPKGRYILHAWHPRVDPVTKTIDVPDTGTVKVDFEL